MVSCCVTTCKNSSTKGFKVYRIPRDPVRRAAWFSQIKRPDFDAKFHVNFYVCEVHFQRGMWELREGKIRLKSDALPTLFDDDAFTRPMGNNIFGSPTDENIDDPIVTKKKMQEEIKRLRDVIRVKESHISHLKKTRLTEQRYKEFFREKYYSARYTLSQMGLLTNLDGCCVKGCKSSSGRGFRMFEFPKEPMRRLIWIKNICGSEWIPESLDSVCEVHFEDDMWTTTPSGKLCLKNSAIPTIFVEPKPHEAESECSISNDYSSTPVKAQLPLQNLNVQDGLNKNTSMDMILNCFTDPLDNYEIDASFNKLEGFQSADMEFLEML